jgi:hypothetical protein
LNDLGVVQNRCKFRLVVVDVGGDLVDDVWVWCGVIKKSLQVSLHIAQFGFYGLHFKNNISTK